MRKNIGFIGLLLVASLTLCGCSSTGENTADIDNTNNVTAVSSADTAASTSSTGNSAATITDSNPTVTSSTELNNLLNNTTISYESVSSADPEAVHANDPENSEAVFDSGFTYTSDAGDMSKSGSSYTITEAGEYTISGTLNGNIIIDAPEDAKVTLVLNNVCISSADAAPIYVVNADKVTIKAKEGSYNVINDTRFAKTESTTEVEDTSANGAGAITSKVDLTISGKGVLVVKASYNNGIHSTKDLTVKNLNLKVVAVNTVIKGKDSVTLKDAELLAISTGGDGIKSEDSDISSSGNQRGNVEISGGIIDIYAACDGITAAYDAIISDNPVINIYTATYSEYSEKADNSTTSNTGTTTAMFHSFGQSNSSKTSYSSKGIKADNAITVNGGTIIIYCKDDGLHANSDVTLESGVNGSGEITINGGCVVITAADDGVHADAVLTINGGYIHVISSYEGLESNLININGGYSIIYASDDGVNACAGSQTPCVTVNGGYLDVTTANGDTDGIDSNGYYKQYGGYVIVKGGASSGMVCGSVDTDKGVIVEGGTIVALGGICETPENSVNGYTSSGTAFSTGDYELTDSQGNSIFKFTVSGSFSSMWTASDMLAEGETYTLKSGDTTVLSWTQEAGQMGAVSNGFGFPGGGGFGGGGNGGGFHGGGRR